MKACYQCQDKLVTSKSSFFYNWFSNMFIVKFAPGQNDDLF